MLSFFGKEPEACLAAVKNEKNQASIEVKGSTGDILTMLMMIVQALKKKIPSFLIEAAFKCDITDEFERNTTVVDMTEFKRQSGK